MFLGCDDGFPPAIDEPRCLGVRNNALCSFFLNLAMFVLKDTLATTVELSKIGL
jgi:hypothetical protein